ncbi:hypothetical protein ACT17_14985 [Mycolicibacterium conceptionense]|uniref:Uncharacterized protein n=1 Tax=Mycolicibacterium conceptionense TaxID=451644 RepID=A0A0J8U9A6_9MYCO|nr:hypothetical protein [Mycolicibacterium conceptionense]KMV17592.1 hypothetical protein ACT17_14985 [Mycolicibacterium conceptionense]
MSVTPNPVFDTLLRLGDGIENVWTEAAFAAEEAVGLAFDDIDDPNVAVAVHDGRIVYIGISDGMLQVPLDELQDALNACILTAFAMWKRQTQVVAHNAA